MSSESSNSEMGAPTDKGSPSPAAGSDGVQNVRGRANSGIEYPGQHDVKLGRGGDANSHIGNIKFREIISQYKPRYIAASRSNKPFVAEEVVRIWRNLKPPGRFLVRSDPSRGDDSTWHDVGDKRARKKASQALREKDRNEDLAASSLQMHARHGPGVPGMPLPAYMPIAVATRPAMANRITSRPPPPGPVAVAPNALSQNPATPANTAASPISRAFMAARVFASDQSRKRTSETLTQLDQRQVAPRIETAAPVAAVQSPASGAKTPATYDPAVTRALQQLLEPQRQQPLAPASTVTASQTFEQPLGQQHNGAATATSTQALHELLRQAQQPRAPAAVATTAAQAWQQLLRPQQLSTSTAQSLQQLFGQQQRPAAHVPAASVQLPASQGRQVLLDQQGILDVQAIQQLLGQQRQNAAQPAASPSMAQDRAILLAAVQLLLETRQTTGNRAQAPLASSSLVLSAAASTAATDPSALGSSLSALTTGSVTATNNNGVASAPLTLLQPLQLLLQRQQQQQASQQLQQQRQRQSADAALTSAIQALLQSTTSPATTRSFPQQQPLVSQLQQLQQSTSVFQQQPQLSTAAGTTNSLDRLLASQILETLLNPNVNSTSPSLNGNATPPL